MQNIGVYYEVQGGYLIWQYYISLSVIVFITGVWSVIHAVQLRKRNKELQLSEERLQLALEGANEGIWDWNAPKETMFFNTSWYKMLGYEPNSFAQSLRTLEDLLHPEDREKTLTFLRHFIRNKSQSFVLEFRLLARTGQYRWIVAKGKTIERHLDHSIIRVSGTHVDITKYKMAAAAMRRSEENLRTTLNSIGDAVLTVDSDGRVISLNPVAEYLLQTSNSLSKGHSLKRIYPIYSLDSGEELAPSLQLSISKGSLNLVNQKVRLNTENKEYIISQNISPITNEKGINAGAVIIFRDISPAVEMEEQLRQIQKMEAVGVLAGGIAHDFNNILNGISGYAELIYNDLNQEQATPSKEVLSELLDYSSEIIKASEKGAQLTSQLLAFSRRQAFHHALIQLHEEIETVVGLLRRSLSKKIEIICDLKATDYFTEGDAAQIQSALLNLGINAGDAMKDGGTLRIVTENVVLKPDALKQMGSLGMAGDYIKITIADSGCGIAPELLTRIFEPFFTTKDIGKGTGLGLAAVHGIINSHAGAIQVNSKLNQGTQFIIYFPQVDQSKITTTKNALATKPESVQNDTPSCILVIDDELSIRTLARNFFAKLGSTVYLAQNGHEGVSLFRRHHHEIDIVLLDMMMPEMDGEEAFAALSKIDPNVKVIICSGFSRNTRIENMLKKGVSGFVQKPFRLQSLRDAIQKTLQNEPIKN